MDLLIVAVLQIILIIVYGGAAYHLGRNKARREHEQWINEAYRRGGKDQIHSATRHSVDFKA
jgi:hypothetical protein